jgi:nucleotide-binding universal stress UspA family protein
MVPSKILVPVDGSPASLRAVDFAIEMASQNPGTSLVLLNVQNIGATELSGAVMGSYDWQEKASQASAKALKEAIGKLEAAGAVLRPLSEVDRRQKPSLR